VKGVELVKRLLVFILIVAVGSTIASFTGCAGTREKARDEANMEDTYRNAADFEKAQDRQRLDHGGY